MLESKSHTDKQVLKHYIKFWGEPKRIVQMDETIEDWPVSIFVAEFFLDTGEDDGIWVYATLGASRQSQIYPKNDKGEKIDRHFELMMYAYQPRGDLMNTLAALALYPFQNNTFLGSGHTIAGAIGQGVVEDSPLTDILLINAVKEPKDFRTFHLEGKNHVDILWVIPLYRSERICKVEHGLEALIDLFSEKELDPADFFRAPIV